MKDIQATVLKRKHTTFQLVTIFHFFPFLWVIFAHVGDQDPKPKISADPDPNLDPQH
jgi:hypothetical protein